MLVNFAAISGPLDDVLRVINKSTSNINTRSNIRRKLELTAEDNLYDFIVSKIKEVEMKG